MEDDYTISEWEAKVRKAAESITGDVISFKPKRKDFGLKSKEKSQYLIERELKEEKMSTYDSNEKYYTSTGEEWEIEEW